MSNTENKPQPPPDDEQPSTGSGDTNDEPNDGVRPSPADSDPPIIVHDTGGGGGGGGTGNP